MDVGTIGSAHPAPEQIPHPSPLSIMQRRRGSSVCSGVSGSVPGLGGMGGFEDEEVMGELPGFGGGGGWGCWSRNGNGNGAGNGRYRRSSLSAAVMGAGGGFDEDGEEGGGGRRR